MFREFYFIILSFFGLEILFSFICLDLVFIFYFWVIRVFIVFGLRFEFCLGWLVFFSLFILGFSRVEWGVQKVLGGFLSVFADIYYFIFLVIRLYFYGEFTVLGIVRYLYWEFLYVFILECLNIYEGSRKVNVKGGRNSNL